MMTHGTQGRLGEIVGYQGFRWMVIDILPHGTRVLYRPWWKLRRTGVIFT